MRLEIIKAFVAVGETGSFSKAAEKLYFSQPTVSRYISELEKELGGALLKRTAHGCELTSFGRRVFYHAKNLIGEWGSIENLSSLYRKNDNKSLRIGYAYEGMLLLITRALSDNREAFSGAELSLRFGEGTDITRMIREGYLNCAVMHLPSLVLSEGLLIRVICECGMCVQVPEEHYLAKQKSVTMEQLSHETEVRVMKEKNFYRMEDEAFFNLNLPAMKHVYVQSSQDCMPMVRYNHYVCVGPSIYEPWPNCRLLPIRDWTTDFTLVFVTKKDESDDTVEKLYQSLCDTVQSCSK